MKMKGGAPRSGGADCARRREVGKGVSCAMSRRDRERGRGIEGFE